VGMATLTTGYVLRRIESVYDSILHVKFPKYSESKKLLMIDIADKYCMRLIRIFDKQRKKMIPWNHYVPLGRTEIGTDLYYHAIYCSDKIRMMILEKD
jgi:hypothetical protein